MERDKASAISLDRSAAALLTCALGCPIGAWIEFLTASALGR